MAEKKLSIITFVISIILVTISIIVPVFTYRSAIEMNSYRVGEIEADRKIVWSRQIDIDERQSDCIQQLKGLMIKLEK